MFICFVAQLAVRDQALPQRIVSAWNMRAHGFLMNAALAPSALWPHGVAGADTSLRLPVEARGR
jgi:hypothetical protein